MLSWLCNHQLHVDIDAWRNIIDNVDRLFWFEPLFFGKLISAWRFWADLWREQ